MPTREEYWELKDYCYFEGVYFNDVAGMFVIGPNGNSIFIPLAGFRMDTTIIENGTNAACWSSSIMRHPDLRNAFYFLFNWDYIFSEQKWHCEPFYGLSVRPVSD